MTSHSAATIRSRYVEQAASDLQENRRRQQELAESITMLKQEEALLLDILTLAERYDAPSDPARVPEQAQREPETAPAEPAAKSAAKPAAKPKSPQPLLGDLLTRLLGDHEEPRHAKELREELMDKHPDRSPTPQVVRNTLESLVAKGRIRRHKQRRSVMYSLV